jgi:hypothetical protein
MGEFSFEVPNETYHLLIDVKEGEIVIFGAHHRDSSAGAAQDFSPGRQAGEFGYREIKPRKGRKSSSDQSYAPDGAESCSNANPGLAGRG